MVPSRGARPGVATFLICGRARQTIPGERHESIWHAGGAWTVGGSAVVDLLMRGRGQGSNWLHQERGGKRGTSRQTAAGSSARTEERPATLQEGAAKV